MSADAPTPLDLDDDGSPFTPDDVELCRARTITMHTRPAPAWDEEAVRESALKRAYRVRRTPIHEDDAWAFGEGARAGIESALAVVRDHLPVKPGMEDIYRAWHGTDDPWGGCADRASIERVLDLFPGRSEAEVGAGALREFADAHRFPSHWIMFRRDDGTGVTVSDMLREVADRLAAEGGAS